MFILNIEVSLYANYYGHRHIRKTAVSTQIPPICSCGLFARDSQSEESWSGLEGGVAKTAGLGLERTQELLQGSI